MKKKAKSNKVFDIKKSRLENIRNKIESGNYQVDPEAIASRLIHDDDIMPYNKKKSKKRKNRKKR